MVVENTLSDRRGGLVCDRGRAFLLEGSGETGGVAISSSWDKDEDAIMG